MPLVFGCEFKETGEIYRQQADGTCTAVRSAGLTYNRAGCFGFSRVACSTARQACRRAIGHAAANTSVIANVSTSVNTIIRTVLNAVVYSLANTSAKSACRSACRADTRASKSTQIYSTIVGDTADRTTSPTAVLLTIGQSSLHPTWSWLARCERSGVGPTVVRTAGCMWHLGVSLPQTNQRVLWFVTPHVT